MGCHPNLQTSRQDRLTIWGEDGAFVIHVGTDERNASPDMIGIGWGGKTCTALDGDVTDLFVCI